MDPVVGESGSGGDTGGHDYAGPTGRGVWTESADESSAALGSRDPPT